ncbi:hypothetical protein EYF80_053597 [Liparis tanakae]|uniref:Uncharacterized protein n=1 Tax=Liparis tanakae TaxID=230148 RepID=A0A4Z2F5W2_9TELE|nr:hypothetical protein EYF80_053597 [Liparis tanakae]
MSTCGRADVREAQSRSQSRSGSWSRSCPGGGKPAGGVKVHTWNGRHARLTRAAANEMTVR